jgi:hypothetical protein
MYIPPMSAPKDLITATQARELLGVSEKKIAQLLKPLRKYTNPLDKRQRLVSKAQVLKLKEPTASAA